jgi:uncharacterized protein YkwD
MLAMTNRERLRRSLSRVDIDIRLVEDAVQHSEAMARANKVSHQLPGEPSPEDRVQAAGYTFSRMGENVAEGQDTALETVQAWMDSPPHRANLLDPDCQHAGFGLAIAGDGTHYWTAVLASPMTAATGDAGPMAAPVVLLAGLLPPGQRSKS